MQLVIEIPEEMYDKVVEQAAEVRKLGFICLDMILDGITLPKNRGRVIDADELKTHVYTVVEHSTLKTLRVVDEETIDESSTILDAYPPAN